MVACRTWLGPSGEYEIHPAFEQIAVHLASRWGKTSLLAMGELRPRMQAEAAVRLQQQGVGLIVQHDLPRLDKLVYELRKAAEDSYRIYLYLRERAPDLAVFDDAEGLGFWSVRAKRLSGQLQNTRLCIYAHGAWWLNDHIGLPTSTEPLAGCQPEWMAREAVKSCDLVMATSREIQHSVGAGMKRELAECLLARPWLGTMPEAAERKSMSGSDLVLMRSDQPLSDLRFLRRALSLLAGRGSALPSRVYFIDRNDDAVSPEIAESLKALARVSPRLTVRHLNYADGEAQALVASNDAIACILQVDDDAEPRWIERLAAGRPTIGLRRGILRDLLDDDLTFGPDPHQLADVLERATETDVLAEQSRGFSAEADWQVLLPEADSAARPAPYVHQQIAPEPISVCVPFFHHDDYIERLAEAFLAINWSDLQLVIVNDGTPRDQCANFMRLKRDLEPLGHIFHTQENGGPGRARNMAVSLAEHDLLLFFDADNVPFPNILSALHGAMRRADLDSVAAPFAAVPPMNRMPDREDILHFFIPPGGPIELGFSYNVFGDVCHLTRREVVAAAGLFGTGFENWEDWEFLLSVVAGNYVHAVYPEPLFFYTFDRQSRNNSADNLMNYLNLLSHLPRLDRSRLCSLAKYLLVERIREAEIAKRAAMADNPTRIAQQYELVEPGSASNLAVHPTAIPAAVSN